MKGKPVRARLIVLFAILVAFAGCGASTPAHHAPVHNFSAVIRSHTCPAGQSFSGCAAPRPSRLGATFGARPTGPLFPDVSSWQGAVNWSSVKAWQVSHGWKAAAIFKLGEYSTDPYASRNASETSRLGFWRSGYWFVRNTGCSHESAQILASARVYRLRVVTLDIEVPEARGYGACLSPPLKRAGLIVVEYTAPGTNPGGADTSDPLWIATYGSGFGCIWTCHPVAWQFTDGQFGFPTSIPGIGTDDVNVDLGIERLGSAPVPPPDPYRFYDKTVRHFRGAHASEYNTVRTWDRSRCPARREVCRSSHAHLVLLRDRLYAVAHRNGQGVWGASANWSSYHRGVRFQGLQRRLR